jgi:hypothetical protein
MKRGISEKTASARCAAMYYKRHGVTVREAAKKAGIATVIDYDDELMQSMLDGKVKATVPSEITATMEAFAINFDFLEDGIIEMIATKEGARAFTSDGVAVTWTLPILKNIAHTWKGGGVDINHEDKFYGSILDSWLDVANLRHVVFVDDYLKGEIKKRLDAGEEIGVSIEAKKVIYDLKTFEITDAVGTNVAIVLHPHKPACTPKDGCTVLLSTTPTNTNGKNMPTDEEMEAKLNEIDGAKLSYKQRQGLPESAFCGPDRSFPAQDAAHVRNGLARLNQSNFSSEQKAGILSCLKSRAKKYNIDVSAAIVGIEADEESATSEKDGQNGVTNMAENTVSAVEYEKAVKELEELRATVAAIHEKDKKALLEKIGADISVDSFKDAPICTLEAVVKAIDLMKVKAAEQITVDSGANATKPRDSTKDNEEKIEGASPEEVKEFKEVAKYVKERYGREVN